MRILGIDPGLRYTGYGCIDTDTGGQSSSVVEAGVIRVPQKRPLPERLAYLYNELTTLMQDTKPDLVVIEQVFDNDKAVLMKLIYLVVRKRLLGHQCLRSKGVGTLKGVCKLTVLGWRVNGWAESRQAFGIRIGWPTNDVG